MRGALAYFSGLYCAAPTSAAFPLQAHGDLPECPMRFIVWAGRAYGTFKRTMPTARGGA